MPVLCEPQAVRKQASCKLESALSKDRLAKAKPVATHGDGLEAKRGSWENSPKEAIKCICKGMVRPPTL